MLVFGATTQGLLSRYLRECNPTGTLFGLTSYSIQTMLRRLGDRVGIKCPAHAFRRGFATELRRQGLSELDIAELGRWSSTAMVLSNLLADRLQIVLAGVLGYTMGG